ncbi:uncharacterized protein [Ptychodera flava]|uniref:uncharacterized protein n=1 Tax=Ptychodera flava TaxID=63121 RepID=UPI00396A7ACF
MQRSRQQGPKVMFPVMTTPKADGTNPKKTSTDNTDQGASVDRPEFKKGTKWFNRYEVDSILGSGTFGVVVRVYDPIERRYRAIKAIKDGSEYGKRNANAEAEILYHIKEHDIKRNSNLIMINSTFQYRNMYCIVTPLYSYDLWTILKVTGLTGLSLTLVRIFGEQVLQALDFLAKLKRQVIHCDIKPDNIVLVHPTSTQVKLIDFGVAHRPCIQNTGLYCQTRWYRSPEVVLGHKYGTQIDMWSLGAVFVELFTGKCIFPASSQHDLMKRMIRVFGLPPRDMLANGQSTHYFFDKLTNNKYQFKDPESQTKVTPMERPLEQSIRLLRKNRGPGGTRPQYKTSKKEMAKFIDLLQQMFLFDPSKRIRPSEALRHPFIDTSVDMQEYLAYHRRGVCLANVKPSQQHVQNTPHPAILCLRGEAPESTTTTQSNAMGTLNKPSITSQPSADKKTDVKSTAVPSGQACSAASAGINSTTAQSVEGKAAGETLKPKKKKREEKVELPWVAILGDQDAFFKRDAQGAAVIAQGTVTVDKKRPDTPIVKIGNLKKKKTTKYGRRVHFSSVNQVVKIHSSGTPQVKFASGNSVTGTDKESLQSQESVSPASSTSASGSVKSSTSLSSTSPWPRSILKVSKVKTNLEKPKQNDFADNTHDHDTQKRIAVQLTVTPNGDSDPAMQTVTPNSVSDPAMQTVTPNCASDPTMQTVTPNCVSDPAMQTVTPNVSDPAMQTVTPNCVSDPAMQTVTPNVSDPAMQTVTPNCVSDLAMQTVTPNCVSDPTMQTVTQNSVSDPTMQTVHEQTTAKKLVMAGKGKREKSLTKEKPVSHLTCFSDKTLASTSVKKTGRKSCVSFDENVEEMQGQGNKAHGDSEPSEPKVAIPDGSLSPVLIYSLESYQKVEKRFLSGDIFKGDEENSTKESDMLKYAGIVTDVTVPMPVNPSHIDDLPEYDTLVKDSTVSVQIQSNDNIEASTKFATDIKEKENKDIDLSECDNDKKVSVERQETDDKDKKESSELSNDIKELLDASRDSDLDSASDRRCSSSVLLGMPSAGNELSSATLVKEISKSGLDNNGSVKLSDQSIDGKSDTSIDVPKPSYMPVFDANQKNSLYMPDTLLPTPTSISKPRSIHGLGELGSKKSVSALGSMSRVTRDVSLPSHLMRTPSTSPSAEKYSLNYYKSNLSKGSINGTACSSSGSPEMIPPYVPHFTGFSGCSVQPDTPTLPGLWTESENSSSSGLEMLPTYIPYYTKKPSCIPIHTNLSSSDHGKSVTDKNEQDKKNQDTQPLNTNKLEYYISHQSSQSRDVDTKKQDNSSIDSTGSVVVTDVNNSKSSSVVVTDVNNSKNSSERFSIPFVPRYQSLFTEKPSDSTCEKKTSGFGDHDTGLSDGMKTVDLESDVEKPTATPCPSDFWKQIQKGLQRLHNLLESCEKQIGDDVFNADNFGNDKPKHDNSELDVTASLSRLRSNTETLTESLSSNSSNSYKENLLDSIIRPVKRPGNELLPPVSSIGERTHGSTPQTGHHVSSIGERTYEHTPRLYHTGHHVSSIGERTHSSTPQTGHRVSSIGERTYGSTPQTSHHVSSIGERTYGSTPQTGHRVSSIGERTYGSTPQTGHRVSSIGERTYGTPQTGHRVSSIGERTYGTPQTSHRVSSIGERTYGSTPQTSHRVSSIGERTYGSTPQTGHRVSSIGERTYGSTPQTGHHVSSIGERTYCSTPQTGHRVSSIGERTYSSTPQTGHRAIGERTHGSTPQTGHRVSSIGERTYGSTPQTGHHVSSIGERTHGSTPQTGHRVSSIGERTYGSTPQTGHRVSSIGERTYGSTLQTVHRVSSIGERTYGSIPRLVIVCPLLVRELMAALPRLVIVCPLLVRELMAALPRLVIMCPLLVRELMAALPRLVIVCPLLVRELMAALPRLVIVCPLLVRELMALPRLVIVCPLLVRELMAALPRLVIMCPLLVRELMAALPRLVIVCPLLVRELMAALPRLVIVCPLLVRELMAALPRLVIVCPLLVRELMAALPRLVIVCPLLVRELMAALPRLVIMCPLLVRELMAALPRLVIVCPLLVRELMAALPRLVIVCPLLTSHRVSSIGERTYGSTPQTGHRVSSIGERTYGTPQTGHRVSSIGERTYGSTPQTGHRVSSIGERTYGSTPQTSHRVSSIGERTYGSTPQTGHRESLLDSVINIGRQSEVDYWHYCHLLVREDIELH